MREIPKLRKKNRDLSQIDPHSLTAALYHREILAASASADEVADVDAGEVEQPANVIQVADVDAGEVTQQPAQLEQPPSAGEVADVEARQLKRPARSS